MRSPRAALRSGPFAVPQFRLLVAGQITSSLGDFFYAVALPFYVLAAGGGPVLLGWVLAAYGIARIGGTALGGVLADRFGARPMMLTADLVRCAAMVILALVAASSGPTFAAMAPIAVVLGLAGGVFVPANFTILPSILPEEDLGAGNAISSIITQAGGLAGPVIGGVVVAAVGAAPAFGIDAASFAVSALVLALIRIRPAGAGQERQEDRTTGPQPSFWQVVRHGQILRVVLTVALIGNVVFAGAAEVALPTLSLAEFGAGRYGTLLMAIALGLLLGAVLARRVPSPAHPAPLVLGLGLAMAASMIALPFAPGWLGVGACLLVFGTANGWSGILLVTMLQIWAPRPMLGRVMSGLALAATGTFPLSVALAGVGVGRFGVTPFFVMAGAAMLLGLTFAATQPAFRRYREGDHFRLPETVAVKG